MSAPEQTPGTEYTLEISDKYVVMKREEYNQFAAHLHAQGQFALLEHLQQLQIIQDYFVIREHDVFAPAGLYAYASNIRTALEFAETGITIIDPEEKQRLLDFADLLNGAADAWSKRQWFKIPD